MDRDELQRYINTLLSIDQFRDYCPNGLQVAGSETVSHIVSGVTASQALIDAAIEQQADVLLVHHGFFWKGESPCITGLKGQRIAALMANNINLMAYHLPLDAHIELGNNSQLAKLLNLYIEERVGDQAIVCVGKLPEPMSPAQLSSHIETALQRQPLHIGHDHSDKPIQKVAWCTGAAQSYLEQAIELGADAFITGEISEQTVHTAREAGIHFYAAGHHATERYGVKALGEHLAEHFSLRHSFIDIDNPV